ncbi:hypothetical protein GZH47_32770 (plasmid) [Paenibacillus rhizovicinus]|uniref:Uncharacterized protein n=1 Tax=Paenibacillus rhizovicinus TaxID=2704463 RepID=A0A6C0PCI5_9BACL|nr:hypothetical protein [Paenibacillus rhizovicinus]QHW35673.1 hypothetical protein GZH47_32770 [Paenibacillus rhizovicinus]
MAKAVPFPVDFKEQHNNRIFKHVSFPGEPGTYRIRAINNGLNTVSTIHQKSISTGIDATDIEGQRYRIKAVLSEPDTGISESYWLSTRHEDYVGVQAFNQYRIRGISLEGWKSDWVYSEARDEANHIVVYEMLYDLLNIIEMIDDEKIEAFLQLMTSDAYQAVSHSEFVRFIPSLEPDELLEHLISETFDSESDRSNVVNESLVAQLKSSFDFIGKSLYSSFKEDFLADKREFADIMKMYRAYDRFQQKPSDIVSMVVEIFLEEYLENIVKASNIEVLLENDENKAIYLEGRYALDVKAEVLRAAYTLMPHDNFVFHANSTVKLLTEPIFREDVNYRIVQETKETLSVFASHLQEALGVTPSEELFFFMRMMFQEAYMPYMLMDQRIAEVMINLIDDADYISGSDGIIEYDVVEGDDVNKRMFLYDLAWNLILGDKDFRYDYEIGLMDKFLNHMTSKRHALVNYHFYEYVDALAEMGERFTLRYKEMPFTPSEQLSIGSKEQTARRFKTSSSVQEDTDLIASDSTKLAPSAAERLSDYMDVLLAEQLTNRSTPQETEHENFVVHYADVAATSDDLRGLVKEYYRILASERLGISPDLGASRSELFHVSANDLVSPQYKPHLWAKYNLHLKTSRDISVTTSLKDQFKLDGREKVLYALGDISAGWPIGHFILGTNTLKG